MLLIDFRLTVIRFNRFDRHFNTANIQTLAAKLGSVQCNSKQHKFNQSSGRLFFFRMLKHKIFKEFRFTHCIGFMSTRCVCYFNTAADNVKMSSAKKKKHQNNQPTTTIISKKKCHRHDKLPMHSNSKCKDTKNV